MTDLVTFGETMLRYSPPGDTPIEMAEEFEVYAAGAESNVAVAASRLGLDATWTSKLPDSPLGRRVDGALRRYGIDTEIVWSNYGRQGTYYFQRGADPRGSEVIYDRADAAVTTATPTELPTDLIEDAEAFHTTGITPALSKTLAKTTADLLSTAQDAGTTTVFDLNYRSKLWDPTTAKNTLTDLFPHIDVLVVAERDAATVLDLDGSAADVASDLAAEYDFETVIVTRGADGALALHDDTVSEQPVFDAESPYPIGTGDSFVGGYLATRLRGGDVDDALEYGAATAALKRTIPGDMAVLTPDAVDDLIEGESEGISR
jgi:2-dehydro-3-deoxygluconokinase